MKKIKIIEIILLIIIGFVGFNIYTLYYGKPWARYMARKKMEAYLDNSFKGKSEITKIGYDLKRDGFFADIKASDDRMFQIKIIDGEIQNYYYAAYWEAQIFEKCNATLLEIFHGQICFKPMFGKLLYGSPNHYLKEYGEMFDELPYYDDVKEEVEKNVSLSIEILYNWKEESFEQEAEKLYEACSFIKSNISVDGISVYYSNKSFEIRWDDFEPLNSRECFNRLLRNEVYE